MEPEMQTNRILYTSCKYHAGKPINTAEHHNDFYAFPELFESEEVENEAFARQN